MCVCVCTQTNKHLTQREMGVWPFKKNKDDCFARAERIDAARYVSPVIEVSLLDK